MKVNISEANERLKEVKKQSDYISEGFDECFRNRPDEFASYPFYIFAHTRTIAIDERIAYFNVDPAQFGYKMENVPTHKMLWQSRLTRPTPQENSMLFKCYPPGDNVKTCWIIPEKGLWPQYEKDNLTESDIVCNSVHMFKNHLEKLSMPEHDDVTEAKAHQIYLEIKRNAMYRNIPNLLSMENTFDKMKQYE